jgi:hypothetical protein
MKILMCLILGITLFCYGCSSRPSLTAQEEGPYNECEALVVQAESEVAAAKKEGAAIFAKNDLTVASLSLKDAKALLERKEFSKAKESAIRAGTEARKIKEIPGQAEAGIVETEKQIDTAKAAMIHKESPSDFREACYYLEAAKIAFNKADYVIANLNATKARNAIKKANVEPVEAKKAFAALDAEMTMAKELNIGAIAPDLFKVAVEAYELSKSSLAERKYKNVLESSARSSMILKTEMKYSTNLYVEQAKIDIAAAKDAGAADMAVEQLAIAEEALFNANAALSKADFVNAKVYAEKGSTTAKEAEAKAKAGKKVIKVLKSASVAPVRKETTKVKKDSLAVKLPIVKVPVAEKPARPFVEVEKETVKTPPIEASKPVLVSKVTEIFENEKNGSRNDVPLVVVAAAVVVALLLLIFFTRLIRKKVTKNTSA